MKRLSLIVLVICFAITTPATAAEKDGKYSAQGARTCGIWIRDHKEKDGWPPIVIETWITGYIAAYNTYNPDVYNILGSTDMQSVYLWMDKYCQENPLSNIAHGMIVLTNELWPNRKRTKGE